MYGDPGRSGFSSDVISTSINQSGQTLELLALLMGGFIVLNYSIAFVMNAINDRIKIKGRS